LIAALFDAGVDDAAVLIAEDNVYGDCAWPDGQIVVYRIWDFVITTSVARSQGQLISGEAHFVRVTSEVV
jgi:hypothetical protein